MNGKELLLAQLNASLENTWFVSLVNSIDGLTEEQASWKPHEETNSIFEIVNHLIFYNHRLLNRIKDIPNDEKGADSTFKNKKDLSWNDTVNLITEITSEWVAVVEKADTKKLDDMAAELAHLTIHTTYHTGQIIYIRKQQGAWNQENGVKG